MDWRCPIFQGKMEGTCQSRNLEYSINFCKTIIIVLLMILIYVFSNKFKSDENLGGKVWNRNKLMHKR